MPRLATWFLFVFSPVWLNAYDPPVTVRQLRNVADIRKLTYEESRLAPPVALRVTVISHFRDGFDGQDSSGGIFFEFPFEGLPRIGDEIEITGNVTGPT